MALSRFVSGWRNDKFSIVYKSFPNGGGLIRRKMSKLTPGTKYIFLAKWYCTHSTYVTSCYNGGTNEKLHFENILKYIGDAEIRRKERCSRQIYEFVYVSLCLVHNLYRFFLNQKRFWSSLALYVISRAATVVRHALSCVYDRYTHVSFTYEGFKKLFLFYCGELHRTPLCDIAEYVSVFTEHEFQQFLNFRGRIHGKISDLVIIGRWISKFWFAGYACFSLEPHFKSRQCD